MSRCAAAAISAATTLPACVVSCCRLQLKDYVEQVLQLQADKDSLIVQLELLQHQQKQQQLQPQAAAAGAADAAPEQQLLELQLQKEQAVAAAVRLKQQLRELFQEAIAGSVAADGAAAGEEAGSTAAADPAGRPHTSPGESVQCGMCWWQDRADSFAWACSRCWMPACLHYTRLAVVFRPGQQLEAQLGRRRQGCCSCGQGQRARG